MGSSQAKCSFLHILRIWGNMGWIMGWFMGASQEKRMFWQILGNPPKPVYQPLYHPLYQPLYQPLSVLPTPLPTPICFTNPSANPFLFYQRPYQPFYKPLPVLPTLLPTPPPTLARSYFMLCCYEKCDSISKCLLSGLEPNSDFCVIVCVGKSVIINVLIKIIWVYSGVYIF